MTIADRYYAWLMTFMGIHYKWGGSNVLEGLDCSGALQLWLDGIPEMNFDPPSDQTAHQLYRFLFQRGVQATAASLGVCLFFGTPAHVIHCAMALDATHMIEAGGGSSDVLTLADAIRKGAVVRRSRIRRRSDLVAMLSPRLPW